MTASVKTRLSIADPRYIEAADFLYKEADMLDELREREWLTSMVSADIVYQVPIRQTVERARGTGFERSTFHLNEDHGSLSARVARGETKYAWCEDPPSRVRHFITNIQVFADAADADELAAKSNILLFRTRQDQTTPQLLSGVREDVLAREDGELKLRRRTVLLDHTVIATHNLSMFF